MNIWKSNVALSKNVQKRRIDGVNAPSELNAVVDWTLSDFEFTCCQKASTKKNEEELKDQQIAFG